jgi:hypothetical protein
MFDLSLFKVPTFVGGSIAAFTMNASLFSVYLYLVLYLQDLLGFSALGTGTRLLINSGATLVAATIAGRLSGHVPVRWLIGPGLALVGIGLMFMSGLSSQSSWTHLIPGFLIAGFGAGMVNPPLASTAIGVVEPQRSGMASGINSTFRQVGVATSIAVQGTIFATVVRHSLSHSLASDPALAGRSSQVVDAIRQGSAGAAIRGVPPSSRGHLVEAIRTAFTSAINDLLIFTASVAFVGAVAALTLIRSKDFVVPSQSPTPEPVQAGGRSQPGS